jgi:hypothetical protein
VPFTRHYFNEVFRMSFIVAFWVLISTRGSNADPELWCAEGAKLRAELTQIDWGAGIILRIRARRIMSLPASRRNASVSYPLSANRAVMPGIKLTQVSARSRLYCQALV